MSRKKKTDMDDMPVVVEEPVVEEVEPAVAAEEEDVAKEPVVVDKEAVLAFARQHIAEHSRRRPGSVTGMMNTVYRIKISGGRVRFFTLPISVEECAIEDNWKRCQSFMTPEEFIAFLTRTLNIPPPPFYTSFRVIAIE